MSPSRGLRCRSCNAREAIFDLAVFERYRMRHPQTIVGDDAFYGAPESIRVIVGQLGGDPSLALAPWQTQQDPGRRR